MPTYAYECQNCGHGFEEFQSITAAPLRKCPKCGKAKLQRLIGPGAAVIFKGGGFYQTDYRSKSYKAAEKADSDDGKKTSGEGASDKSSGDSAKSSGDSANRDQNKPDKKGTGES